MPCYRPVKAWYGNKLASGKREIVFSSGQAQSCMSLALPCGTCVGCRLERARQWAMRCNDEKSLYSDNCFITLSVNPESLKLHGDSLNHGYFQKFMKRLRKHFDGRLIRYFMCGEYGPTNGRAHYHALLFNVDFKDRVFFRETDAGESIYRSATLEKLWPYGFSSVGDITFGSAAYVARYHLKKVGGVVSDNHYLNKRTGEMLSPEYVRMSRGSKSRGTGGIARGWYEKWKSDVYPRDVRVIKGVDTLPCKFYDKLYEHDDVAGYEKLKVKRALRGNGNRLDNTEDRLLVKEKVKLSQLKVLNTSKEI